MPLLLGGAPKHDPLAKIKAQLEASKKKLEKAKAKKKHKEQMMLPRASLVTQDFTTWHQELADHNVPTEYSETSSLQAQSGVTDQTSGSTPPPTTAQDIVHYKMTTPV